MAQPATNQGQWQRLGRLPLVLALLVGLTACSGSDPLPDLGDRLDAGKVSEVAADLASRLPIQQIQDRLAGLDPDQARAMVDAIVTEGMGTLGNLAAQGLPADIDMAEAVQTVDRMVADVADRLGTSPEAFAKMTPDEIAATLANARAAGQRAIDATAAQLAALDDQQRALVAQAAVASAQGLVDEPLDRVAQRLAAAPGSVAPGGPSPADAGTDTSVTNPAVSDTAPGMTATVEPEGAGTPVVAPVPAVTASPAPSGDAIATPLQGTTSPADSATAQPASSATAVPLMAPGQGMIVRIGVNELGGYAATAAYLWTYLLRESGYQPDIHIGTGADLAAWLNAGDIDIAFEAVPLFLNPDSEILGLWSGGRLNVQGRAGLSATHPQLASGLTALALDREEMRSLAALVATRGVSDPITQQAAVQLWLIANPAVVQRLVHH